MVTQCSACIVMSKLSMYVLYVLDLGEPSHGGTGSLTKVYVETFNLEETDCPSKPTKQLLVVKVL